MSVKIVHCADLHFDTPFTGMDSVQKAEIRREELRQVFGRIVALAAEEKADALIICGDLFDHAAVSAYTLRFLREKLASIPDIPVFISAGNHDPNLPGSYYRIFDWSENVHIFPRQIEKIECKGFNIYGSSFAAYDEAESMLTGFCVENPEEINILAMHADIGGVYNPITEEEIEKSGADYLALGHIHRYSGPMHFGTTTAVYPGCPEGRGFDELGEKGAVLAEISKDTVSVQFRPLCKRQYHELIVPVDGVYDYETLCGRILLAMNGSAEDIYKITLTGEAEFSVQPAVILESLKCFSAKIKDQTTAKVDYDALKNEFTLKGLFVKNMLDCVGTDSELKSLALSMGLDALNGEKVILP